MVGKHRVLIFGEKVYGATKPKLSIEYCEIEYLSFPNEYSKLSDLADYSLVLLDYSAFYINNKVYEAQQEVFEKLMRAALDRGTSFCILHYDEGVPRQEEYSSLVRDMNKQEILFYQKQQIGFNWLRKLQIRPYKFDSLIITTVIMRNEFNDYQRNWGASKNIFVAFDNGKFDDVIFSRNEEAISGFSSSVGKGKIIYLPCQRDFSRPNSLSECLQTLIESTITYLTRSSAEIPDWAAKPIFDEEERLRSEVSMLQTQIENTQTLIKPYDIAKKLAFLAEYDFEDAIPHFLQTHLKLSTQREEQYKEDFWLVDEAGTKITIGETKTHVRGLKPQDISKLDSHRDSYDLPDTFPGLLIANVHRNANSWKEKIRQVDKQVYERAVQSNILIVRIEDLLFFWNLIIEGKNSKEELLSNILHENGWMEVKKDGTITIHK